jgi:hypothetical protein
MKRGQFRSMLLVASGLMLPAGGAQAAGGLAGGALNASALGGINAQVPNKQPQHAAIPNAVKLADQVMTGKDGVTAGLNHGKLATVTITAPKVITAPQPAIIDNGAPEIRPAAVESADKPAMPQPQIIAIDPQGGDGLISFEVVDPVMAAEIVQSASGQVAVTENAMNSIYDAAINVAEIPPTAGAGAMVMAAAASGCGMVGGVSGCVTVGNGDALNRVPTGGKQRNGNSMTTPRATDEHAQLHQEDSLPVGGGSGSITPPPPPPPPDPITSGDLPSNVNGVNGGSSYDPLDRPVLSLRDNEVNSQNFAYSGGYFVNSQTLDLSIVGGNAAGTTDFGALAPAAGGDPEALGELSPAAGGLTATNTSVNCANAYLEGKVAQNALDECEDEIQN